MKNINLGLFLVRLGLAIAFIAHGYSKLTGLDGTGMFFDKLGIPMPVLMAYVVTAVEFLGGILMFLGLFVEYVGPLMAVDMVVAIMATKFPKGFVLPLAGRYELELVLLLCALGIAFAGAGSWSVMKFFKKKEAQI